MVDTRSSLSERMLGKLHALNFEDVPSTTIAAAKRLVLDSIACIIGGATAPGIGAIHDHLLGLEPDGQATVLINGRRTSACTAAFLNGAAGHALDFDDQHDPARIHAFVIAFSSALAAAQTNGVGISNRDFLRAIILGTECHARLGLACSHSILTGWLPTTTFGAPAAAITAGSLLNLNLKSLVNAFGLGAQQSAGTIQSRDEGVLSKRLGPGFAARAGVLAALLAQAGISAPRFSLEGAGGLFSVYERDLVDTSSFLEGLGERWEVERFSLKPYPCCRCSHTAIALALMLREQLRDIDNIERVCVRMSRANIEAVGGAYANAERSTTKAQFSAAYCIATALRYGTVDLSSFSTKRIETMEAERCVRKVELDIDDELGPNAVYPATMSVVLNTGETLNLHLDRMPGSPDLPLSTSDIETKLKKCGMSVGVSEGACHQLAQIVDTLDESASVAHLLAAFERVAAERGQQS